MQTGDVLFYKGRSLISRVILWVTGSPYTHVTVVVRGSEGGNAPLILEAQRFMKTTIRELYPSEEFEIYRIPDLPEEQKRNIELLAQTYKGLPYDYLEQPALILRSLFNKNMTWFESANKVYCSEVIDYLFYGSGVQRWLKVDVGDVYPHELFQVYNLRKLGKGNLQLISDK